MPPRLNFRFPPIRPGGFRQGFGRGYTYEPPVTNPTTGQQTIVGSQFSPSVMQRAEPAAYQGLSERGRIGFATGRVARDVVGLGTRSRVLFNAHPLDFSQGMTYRALREQRVPTWYGQTAGAGVGLAVGLGSGNLNAMNLAESGRPTGYQALVPQEDDPRRTQDPLSEWVGRGFFGKTGKLLPYEELVKERPDISEAQYTGLKKALFDSDRLFGGGGGAVPYAQAGFGTFRFIPNNPLSNQPEVVSLGYRVPLSGAVLGGLAAYGGYRLGRRLFTQPAPQTYPNPVTPPPGSAAARPQARPVTSGGAFMQQTQAAPAPQPPRSPGTMPASSTQKTPRSPSSSPPRSSRTGTPPGTTTGRTSSRATSAYNDAFQRVQQSIPEQYRTPENIEKFLSSDPAFSDPLARQQVAQQFSQKLGTTGQQQAPKTTRPAAANSAYESAYQSAKSRNLRTPAEIAALPELQQFDPLTRQAAAGQFIDRMRREASAGVKGDIGFRSPDLSYSPVSGRQSLRQRLAPGMSGQQGMNAGNWVEPAGSGESRAQSLQRQIATLRNAPGDPTPARSAAIAGLEAELAKLSPAQPLQLSPGTAGASDQTPKVTRIPDQSAGLPDTNDPRFVAEQLQAAKQRGDTAGARAWEQEQRRINRGRLQADIKRTGQTQTNLFGVTEYASDMPLFGTAGAPDQPRVVPTEVVTGPAPTDTPPPRSPAGDKIRAQVAKLREESAIQKQAVARIVGAAGQMANNYDAVVTEAADAMRANLDDQQRPSNPAQRMQDKLNKLDQIQGRRNRVAAEAQAIAQTSLNEATGTPGALPQPPAPRVAETPTPTRGGARARIANLMDRLNQNAAAQDATDTRIMQNAQQSVDLAQQARGTAGMPDQPPALPEARSRTRKGQPALPPPPEPTTPARIPRTQRGRLAAGLPPGEVSFPEVTAPMGDVSKPPAQIPPGSAPKMQVIQGGAKTLPDLFAEADRIGAKYQTPGEPVDLAARRQANQILDQAGYTATVDYAMGKGEKPVKPKFYPPYDTPPPAGNPPTPATPPTPPRIPYQEPRVAAEVVEKSRSVLRNLPPRGAVRDTAQLQRYQPPKSQFEALQRLALGNDLDVSMVRGQGQQQIQVYDLKTGQGATFPRVSDAYTAVRADVQSRQQPSKPAPNPYVLETGMGLSTRYPVKASNTPNPYLTEARTQAFYNVLSRRSPQQYIEDYPAIADSPQFDPRRTRIPGTPPRAMAEYPRPVSTMQRQQQEAIARLRGNATPPTPYTPEVFRQKERVLTNNPLRGSTADLQRPPLEGDYQQVTRGNYQQQLPAPQPREIPVSKLSPEEYTRRLQVNEAMRGNSPTGIRGIPGGVALPGGRGITTAIPVGRPQPAPAPVVPYSPRQPQLGTTGRQVSAPTAPAPTPRAVVPQSRAVTPYTPPQVATATPAPRTRNLPAPIPTAGTPTQGGGFSSYPTGTKYRGMGTQPARPGTAPKMPNTALSNAFGVAATGLFDVAPEAVSSRLEGDSAARTVVRAVARPVVSTAQFFAEPVAQAVMDTKRLAEDYGTLIKPPTVQQRQQQIEQRYREDAARQEFWQNAPTAIANALPLPKSGPQQVRDQAEQRYQQALAAKQGKPAPTPSSGAAPVTSGAGTVANFGAQFAKEITAPKTPAAKTATPKAPAPKVAAPKGSKAPKQAKAPAPPPSNPNARGAYSGGGATGGGGGESEGMPAFSRQSAPAPGFDSLPTRVTTLTPAQMQQAMQPTAPKVAKPTLPRQFIPGTPEFDKLDPKSRQTAMREFNRTQNTTQNNETKLQVAGMQYGEGGSVDRTNASREAIAGMQYGTGGSVDRTNASRERIAGGNNASREKIADMRFGLGGSQDRTNASRLEGTKYTADKRYDGVVYNANSRLQGTVYTANARLEGTKYTADKRYEGQDLTSGRKLQGDIYKADRGYEGKVDAATIAGDARIKAADLTGRSRVAAADTAGQYKVAVADLTGRYKLGQEDIRQQGAAQVADIKSGGAVHVANLNAGAKQFDSYMRREAEDEKARQRKMADVYRVAIGARR